MFENISKPVSGAIDEVICMLGSKYYYDISNVACILNGITSYNHKTRLEYDSCLEVNFSPLLKLVFDDNVDLLRHYYLDNLYGNLKTVYNLSSGLFGDDKEKRMANNILLGKLIEYKDELVRLVKLMIKKPTTMYCFCATSNEVTIYDINTKVGIEATIKAFKDKTNIDNYITFECTTQEYLMQLNRTLMNEIDDIIKNKSKKYKTEKE